MGVEAFPKLTNDFIIKYHDRLVWLRYDYLCMAGICYNDDRQLYDYLTKALDMKEQLEKEGYKFKC